MVFIVSYFTFFFTVSLLFMHKVTQKVKATFLLSHLFASGYILYRLQVLQEVTLVQISLYFTAGSCIVGIVSEAVCP